MLHAARGARHARGPGEGRDGAEGLRGLGVCLRRAGCVGVDAGVVLIVAQTGFEGAVLGVVGGVVGAPDAVIDVLAEVCGVGACRVACFEAEEVTAHEAMQEVVSIYAGGEEADDILVPFDDLCVGAVVRSKASGVDDTTHWVTPLHTKNY